jgi:hypothetical protein
MNNKVKCALAVLLMLGTASLAQAGSKDDPDPRGGYDFGPLGQVFETPARPFYGYGGPAYGYAGESYGYAGPGYRGPIRSNGLCWANTGAGNFGWIPCP